MACFEFSSVSIKIKAALRNQRSFLFTRIAAHACMASSTFLIVADAARAIYISRNMTFSSHGVASLLLIIIESFCDFYNINILLDAHNDAYSGY